MAMENLTYLFPFDLALHIREHHSLKPVPYSSSFLHKWWFCGTLVARHSLTLNGAEVSRQPSLQHSAGLYDDNLLYALFKATLLPCDGFSTTSETFTQAHSTSIPSTYLLKRNLYQCHEAKTLPQCEAVLSQASNSAPRLPYHSRPLTRSRTPIHNPCPLNLIPRHKTGIK